MFHEESDEVEKHVGGLPFMIWGNVISYQPKTMEKAIEFANDQMDQKVLTIAERQAEQKRKLEFNARNNQGHQQQNKRQNTGMAYTAGPGEKKEYTRLLPLCTKCSYHHKGPCAPMCNECKKIGHLARDCRSSGSNGAFQERLPEAEEWKPCINLMPVELGSFDIIVGMDWLAKYHAVIDYAEKIVRHHAFLVHVTTKEIEDKSVEKRLEDVPIIQDFPKDLSGLPPT
ncbi:putative reverse transcriptase domain-containing protein [Tanacetum coccineum]